MKLNQIFVIVSTSDGRGDGTLVQDASMIKTSIRLHAFNRNYAHNRSCEKIIVARITAAGNDY